MTGLGNSMIDVGRLTLEPNSDRSQHMSGDPDEGEQQGSDHKSSTLETEISTDE